MINIASNILIYRSPRRVFDFISSSANDFEWQYGTLAAGQVSEGAKRVGVSFRTVGHLMGQRMTGTFEVTEFDMDRQYGFKSLSGPLDLHTRFTLEGFIGGTRVNVVTQASPTGALQASDRSVQEYMQKQLTEDLALMKTLLEEREVPKPVA
jgi:hypothetical protein